MRLPWWLESALGVCQRRKVIELGEDETPFWELPSKQSEEVQEEEKPSHEARNYEQALHLKDEGKGKFAKGDTNEAMECWVHALDALCLPPPQPEAEDGSPLPETAPYKPFELSDDPQVKELRISLLLNLALGHKKLRQWRHLVSYCDEALHDDAANVKALYLKADALGELCSWKEAEEVAAKLEEGGDDKCRAFAAQKRHEWRSRRKEADAQQKKMWSNALTDDKADAKAKAAPPAGDAAPLKCSCGEVWAAAAKFCASCGKPRPVGPPKVAAPEPVKPPAPAPKAKVFEKWCLPKIEQMCVFDLRRKGIEWDESEDFSDAVWRDGLGRREAIYFQQRALPLTLLAGSVLAELDFGSELIVHCILDGNTAPFAQPHDWSSLLRRAPHIKTLTVVYIDIGLVPVDPSGAPPQMPYGTLLRPTEEGRVGDRVARAARFLGTYKEFQGHCRDLPGLVVPTIALWADVSLYGFNDEDLAIRLEAYKLLTEAGVPSMFTQPGEIQEPGGPPMAPRVEDSGALSLAITGVGLRPRMAATWHWNRFVVPLDRGEHGILAAHAMVGVTKPVKPGTVVNVPSALTIKKAMKDRGVALAPTRLPKHPAVQDREAEELRRKQWEAFSRKMKQAGRPFGPNMSAEERNRQAMEFYQFCGIGDSAPPGS